MPTETTIDLAALGNLPDDTAVDIQVFGALVSCSARSIHRLVAEGLAPAPIRVGHLCRWRIGVIRQWLRDGCPAQVNPQAP
jgi:predicted DNA-binding transcriptional regulator AlpA